MLHKPQNTGKYIWTQVDFAFLALFSPGKHKMLSKLATQSFNILRLIARNQNFCDQKCRILTFRDCRDYKWPKNGPKWP